MPEARQPLGELTLQNQALLDLVLERDRLYFEFPEKLYPILLRPCTVKVLLVADGGLDFSMGDFGLRTFVGTLRTTAPYYARFEITVGHIEAVGNDSVMLGHPWVARGIRSFRFDDPSHFTPDMYDEVWLFGIATSYADRGTAANGQPYPNNRLADTELRALSEHMDGGRGLFATGDHGYLGTCLSGAVPRARSMRLWGDTDPDPAHNEVSMGGPRRNDTNRSGPSAGTQFNDQSDHVPQLIDPTMYYRWRGFLRVAYPHPLLCGPRGVIRVMPDHPHEGQCALPADTEASDTFSGYAIVEYPTTGGSVRPLPEMVATSHVLSGTTAAGKTATDAHSFGSIAAYDGHRANVGRVVTDATWHHFVNVNLIGDTTVPLSDPKRRGFLWQAPDGSYPGQVALDDIKAYYRNIAVWIAPATLIACMNSRIRWGLLWHHRVLEAVLTHTDVALKKATPTLLFEVGRHARDALGQFASECQSLEFMLDQLKILLPVDLLEKLDPWWPKPVPPIPEPDPPPWLDPSPILDMALGGTLLALREDCGVPDVERAEEASERISSVADRGARYGVELALQSLRDVASFVERAGGHPDSPRQAS